MSTTVPLMKLSAENQKHTIAGRQHAVEVRERLGRILDTTSFERRKKSWLDRELMRDASTPRYHTRTKGTFLSCTILDNIYISMTRLEKESHQWIWIRMMKSLNPHVKDNKLIASTGGGVISFVKCPKERFVGAKEDQRSSKQLLVTG
eukprot:scaffold3215_cov248-Chaetoceros_neogracile.AAC.2